MSLPESILTHASEYFTITPNNFTFTYSKPQFKKEDNSAWVRDRDFFSSLKKILQHRIWKNLQLVKSVIF